jgi:transcriptional regulator with XRE-family HTH domain
MPSRGQGKDASALVDFVREWLHARAQAPLVLAQRAGIPHTTLYALFNHGTVPRPNTLRKLAAAMDVPVGRLLVLAGHLSEADYEAPVDESSLARLYEVGDLSPQEWEQVREFARFVRSKRPR